MAAEGGVFVDILARLNAASIDRVIRDAQSMMKEAGSVGGDAFTTSLDRSIAASSREVFQPLVAASNAAYREMQIGLANLQVAEAKINDLRVRNFQQSTGAMIRAQKELDAAIANSQRLTTEASLANTAVRDAPVVVPDRTPKPRAAVAPRAAGIAGMAGTAFLAYGVDQNIQVGRNTQQVYARGNENQNDIAAATNWMWQNSGRLGTSPKDLSGAYNQTEKLGYRGQDALNIVDTAAEVAKRSGADITETVKGLDTTLQDLGFSTSEHKANLDQINSTASQLTQTLDRMKISGDQATEFFAALHSLEPVLMAIQNGVPGNVTQAQGDAMLQVLSQHGITPEQASQNAGHFAMQLAGMRPGSPQYEALAQLGLQPQDIASQVQTQGITTALNTIHNQVQSKSFIGPDGQQLIHTGMQFSNDQLYDISKQIYGGLSDAGRAFIDSHPEVNSGVASGASLRKDLEKGQLPGDDVQDILAYSHDRALLTGLNPKVKKGGEADMTPAEYYNWLFGSGDTSRTGGILLKNMPDVNKAVDVNTQAGSNNYLGGSFDKLMQGLPQQWQEFTAGMQGLAGSLSQSVIPGLTNFVGKLNEVIGWLDKHKAAEQALADVMVDVAAAWALVKITDLATAVLGLTTASTNATGQVATMGKDAEVAGTEMAEAGLGGALKGAAANIAAAFAPAALAAIIGQQIAGPADQWVADNVPGGNWLENHTPGQLGQDARQWFDKTFLPTNTPPAAPKLPPGRAQGGIVGYSIGGVADQPLMGVPDTGGDSVLGMLPNGQPVGLRGGEGILTPDTVDMLGGEAGVNDLNAKAKNPWKSGKVVSTFYDSFAKGVAKYSPWGKYLEATGQSLSSLEQQQVDANKIQQGGDKGLADFMINFYEDKYGAAGDKYAGPSMKSVMNNPGKYWYNPDTGGFQSGAVKGGSPGVMDAIMNAAQSMGLDQRQFDDVKWIFSHESGFDPTISNGGGHGAPSNNKAYGLGQFLGHMGDKYGAMGAYSGDPGQETRAAIQYMIDRYGSPAAAKAYWQAHGSYAHGGVVGYDGGGVMPVTPHQGTGAAPGPGTAGNAQKYPALGNPHYPPPAPPKEKKPPKPLTDGPKKDVYGNTPNAFKIPDGTAPAGDRNIMDNPSQQLTAEGKGLSFGGGLLGAAESAVAAAAPFGSGAAAQPLFDLANRAMGYGGQLLGIGIEGLMETVLPNNSPAADPSKNIFGKMALGIAGAHPSGNNMAGSHAKQLDPKKDLDQGAMQGKQNPFGGIHIDNIHNNTGDHSETFTAINKAVNFANHSGTFAGQ